MAPPVNELGHPPDVIVIIVPMETDVKHVVRGFKVTVAHSAYFVTKETIVTHAQMITMATIVVSVALLVAMFVLIIIAQKRRYYPLMNYDRIAS